jgi:hypothetical protein
MFIKENFKARHRLLKILHRHGLQFQPLEDLHKSSIHFEEIHKQLPQYDKNFLLDNLDYLRSTDEIYCSMKFDKSVFAILSQGSHAYRDKKYIHEGVKERINYIYDIAKTVSVVVLLVIAIWTFAQNIVQTKQNKSDIERLRQELQDIRKEIKSKSPQAKIDQ